MDKRNNPVTVYLTDEEKAQLQRWADESGKSLSDTLREAVLEYTDKDRFARIEDKLDRALALADGGTDTSCAGEHTHAPQSTVDEKPSANAATEKKVRYLAECVIESEVPNSRELKQVPRDTLREIVEDEYGFRSDTAKRYVAGLVDHFDLVDHPTADPLLVSEAERENILADRRDETAEESSDRLDELDTVTHE